LIPPDLRPPHRACSARREKATSGASPPRATRTATRAEGDPIPRKMAPIAPPPPLAPGQDPPCGPGRSSQARRERARQEAWRSLPKAPCHGPAHAAALKVDDRVEGRRGCRDLHKETRERHERLQGVAPALVGVPDSFPPGDDFVRGSLPRGGAPGPHGRHHGAALPSEGRNLEDRSYEGGAGSSGGGQ
jgi:hypothetical protein